MSAIRAVNEFSECAGAVTSARPTSTSRALSGTEGLPSEKVCPHRRAQARTDRLHRSRKIEANNFYEYTIDERLCNGCGRCVMQCKEPAGLSSIKLEVRHDVCLDCNRCSIAIACPEDAYERNEPLAT